MTGLVKGGEFAHPCISGRRRAYLLLLEVELLSETEEGGNVAFTKGGVGGGRAFCPTEKSCGAGWGKKKNRRVFRGREGPGSGEAEKSKGESIMRRTRERKKHIF